MYLLTTIKLPVRLVDHNLEIFEYYDYHYWYVYKCITEDISHLLYGHMDLFFHFEIVAQELWKTV